MDELPDGAERVDPVRREAPLSWIDTIRVRFRGRIVDVDALATPKCPCAAPARLDYTAS
jgi:hypothetical protein